MKQSTYRRASREVHRIGQVLIVILATLWVQVQAIADSQEAVRIAGSAWVGDAPTWVAAQLDLFNRDLDSGVARIEVQLHHSGLEALQHLLAGQAEFALAATTPTALALTGILESGKPYSDGIVVLASVALSNQSHFVIGPARSGIDSPPQLAGRRVGTMFGTSSHFGWTQFSRFHGLEQADVELVDVAVSDMARALLDGHIDAAVIWQPWDVVLREALDNEVHELPMRLLYTINWLLLADREFVVRHPDVAERVLQAYIDSVELIDADPGSTLAMHAAAIDVDAEMLEALAPTLLWRVGMNWSVLVNLGMQFEWLGTWPELSGVAMPQPQDFLYGEPLQKLAPELVTLPDYLLTSTEQFGHRR